MSEKIKISVGYEGHLEELEVTLPAGEPRPWDAQSKLSIVGQRVPRLDGRAKVTGRAKYTWDLHLPGMLHGRILRAPIAAGTISSLDVVAARALPGVKDVWSERVGKRIFYAGQEVAAVCATTPEIAEDALRLIKVGYAKRPFVVDATEARQPGAPLVFDVHKGPIPSQTEAEPEPDSDDDAYAGAKTKHEGNVRVTSGESRGADIDRAFAEAHVIVERTYRTQVQTQSALETHGSLATWSGDELTIYSSTQTTFGVRDQVAEALRLPKDKVRVVCEYMGGGFGAKFMAGHWSIIAAKMAKTTGAPVKMMLGRADEHLCTGNRPDSVQWLKLGATSDGRIVALHLKSYGNSGIGTGAGTGGPAKALYAIKNVRVEEADVFTNTGGAQPFRAPGHPQGCFALEQAVDELAEKLGMDPVALRKKNLVNPITVAELDRAVGKTPAWAARAKAGTGAGNGSTKRGVGLACGVWYKIVSKGAQAQIDVHSDGRVEVKNGAQDIGTGTRTLMAQVAAEELGLPLEAITVSIGDTSWPVGPGSGGSTTATSIMPAVRAAAFQIKEQILAIAAPMLKAKPAELSVAGGQIFVTAARSRSLAWRQVARRIAGEKLSVVATRAPDWEGQRDRMGGVQIAEVEVDTATGQVRVRKVTAVQDFGRPLNRLTAESQINGGVIQGVSYALFENRVIDRRTGVMINPNLEAYKIAYASDCPEITVEIFDVSPGWNNTGALGLGEPPTVPTAAAIANAVANAIGVRIFELPITPDRVLAALGAVAAVPPASSSPAATSTSRAGGGK